MSRSGFYALKLSGITSGRRGLEQRARCGRRPSEILTNPSTTDCTRYRGRRAATIIDFEPQPRIHVDTDLEILRGWQGRNVLGGYGPQRRAPQLADRRPGLTSSVRGRTDHWRVVRPGLRSGFSES